MSGVTRLTSPANPRVKAVIRLRRQRERRRTGLFVAEGWRELERACDAGLGVHELFLCPALLEPASAPTSTGCAPVSPSILDRLPGEVRVFEVTEPLMKKMSGLAEPPGLIGVIEQPSWSLAELPAVRRETRYLIAVGIEKPGNLGAMARTAAAAGCEAMLVAESVVDAFNPHAIRNSTGAVFALPTVPVSREAVLDLCETSGIRLAAATLREATDYTAADLTGPLAITVGPEDAGLDEDWHHAADRTGGPRVQIPVRSELVDSLNAANAAAVLLFEARRQHDWACAE